MPRAALPQPGQDPRRGRRVVGVVFSRRRARSAAGRCGSRASGAHSIQGDVRFAEVLRADGRAASTWATTGSRRARRPRASCSAIDLDLNHIPDAAMTAAVAALFADGPSTLRNIAQLAREGDRPHRRDGDRAAQARRGGGGGRRISCKITPPAQAQRPASRSTPTTTTAWRCASRSPRSGGVPVRINDPDCVAKTFPEYFDGASRG